MGTAWQQRRDGATSESELNARFSPKQSFDQHEIGEIECPLTARSGQLYRRLSMNEMTLALLIGRCNGQSYVPAYRDYFGNEEGPHCAGRSSEYRIEIL